MLIGKGVFSFSLTLLFLLNLANLKNRVSIFQLLNWNRKATNVIKFRGERQLSGWPKGLNHYGARFSGLLPGCLAHFIPSRLEDFKCPVGRIKIPDNKRILSIAFFKKWPVVRLWYGEAWLFG